ncbi:TIGR02597 family protein [Coraliomargarita sp. W4R53]
MKTLSLLTSAALLTFTSLSAVSTDPVGYVTQVATAGDDTVAFPQLLKSPDLVGSPTNISGGVLTIGSNLNVNGFADTHFLLFCTGDLEGEWFQITSNDANTVTVAEDVSLLGAATTDSVKVIEFWTLGSLLEVGEFPGSPNIADPVAFVLLNNPSSVGTNLSSGEVYFYHTGEQIAAGWYLDGDFSETRDDKLISPETYFTIRNGSGADASFLVAGTVPVDVLATQVGRLASSAQDNQLVNPYPSPLTLGESLLVSSGAVVASPNIADPIDFVLVFDNGTSSGTNASPSHVYFYHSGEQITAGWYLDGDFSQTRNADTIPAGGAFIVRKANGAVGTVKWAPPVPYAAQL